MHVFDNTANSRETFQLRGTYLALVHVMFLSLFFLPFFFPLLSLQIVFVASSSDGELVLLPSELE